MKYFQLLWKKSNFVSLRKQAHVSSNYNLQSPLGVQISNQVFKQTRDCKINAEMGKCKTKAIQADLGIFRYIPAYSGIFRHIQTIRHIQVQSGIIQTQSQPCVTLAYSKLWYIQNPGIFKTRDIFRTLVYPKYWHIQNQRHIQNLELFRNLGYSEQEAYSESCQISTMERFEKQLTAIIIFQVIIIFAISAFYVLQFMK